MGAWEAGEKLGYEQCDLFDPQPRRNALACDDRQIGLTAPVFAYLYGFFVALTVRRFFLGQPQPCCFICGRRSTRTGLRSLLSAVTFSLSDVVHKSALFSSMRIL